jgi:hypothetical protein
MALTETLAAVKWYLLATLVGLALAVIFLQQRVGFLAILFALASGWSAHGVYARARGQRLSPRRRSRARNAIGSHPLSSGRPPTGHDGTANNSPDIPRMGTDKR